MTQPASKRLVTEASIQDPASPPGAFLNSTFARSMGDFSANAYGADPAAAWDVNRDAFQAANDAAYAAGGGRVTAKAGTYNVKGILQDSRVDFHLPGVTFKHPDGLTTDIIRARTRSTTGSIAAGSNTLTVASATGFEVGCVVGVRGPGGMSALQSTTITAGIDATQTTGITLADTTGFANSGYLVCGTEIIGYTGQSAGTLSGVTRGVYGTTAAAHTAGDPIGLATRLIAEVTAVSGTTITLSEAAPFAVTSAPVSVGVLRPAVTGLRIDGTRPDGSAPNVYAIRWEQARWGRISGYEAYRCESALHLSQGTRDCDVSLKARECSVPEASAGSVIWLFQRCVRNNLHDITISGDVWVGVYLDNRTSLATEWDGPDDDNTGTNITVDVTPHSPMVANSAVIVDGGARNKFSQLTFRNIRTGIVVQNETQVHTYDGSRPNATHNKYDLINMVGGYQPYLLYTAGNSISHLTYDTTTTRGTAAAGNLITMSATLPGGDPVLDVNAATGLADPKPVFDSLLASLGDETRSVAIQVIGDSTGNDTTDWPYRLAQSIAPLYPDWTVHHRLWNDATQDYGAPTVIQTGTAGDRYLDGSTGTTSRQLPAGESAYVAGVLDVRVKMSLTDWTPASLTAIVGRNGADPQRGWYAGIDGSTGANRPLFVFSPTGLGADFVTLRVVGTPTVADGAVIWMRWVFTPDDGAGNKTLAAYQSDDGVTWTQIGTTLVSAGTSSIFNNSATGYALSGGSGAGLSAGTRLYEVQIRDGADGPNVVPAMPDLWPPYGTTSAGFTGAPVLTFVNGSHPGAAISYLGDATRIKKLAPNYGQAAVFLSSSHNEGSVSGRTWLDTYNGWVTTVNGQLPHIPIIALTQNPEQSGASWYRQHARRRLDLLAYARAEGVEVIDTYQAFMDAGWPGALMADSVHPNAAGSDLWRDTILKAMGLA